MNRKFILSILILLLVISIYGKSNEQYFKFKIFSKNELEKLSKVISIDKVVDGSVFAYANQKELSEFKEFGYSIEYLAKPSKAFIPEMAESTEEMRNWDEYPTYGTYVDMMYQFQTDHPGICSVTSIGQSIEGRELLVAKISDNLSLEEDEPEFFYTGQMHGDEVVTYIMLLHLIDYILDNYGSNDRITNLVNNMEIYINPLSNPDGTYAGGNSTVWGATRYNSNSVDLNRNFPDPEDGPHPDGNDWQPENILMMDFANDHSLVLSSNLHSGAEVLNYPWDTWEHLTADDLWWQDVCHTYADTVHLHAPADYLNEFNNGITNGYAWYSISGGRQDYMNFFQRCREMTLELSDVKLLPESELQPHWEYNRQSFLLYMEESLFGIRGIVTDMSAQPLATKITIIDHELDNSEVFTDPDVGDYHRMLAPGTYDIEFSSYGYNSHIENNIQVSDGEVVTLNIQMDEAAQYDISGVVTNAFTSDSIENAVVELLDTPIEPVTTNSNGEYEILDAYEGNYEIKVSAENFSTFITEISINGQNTIFDFELYECEIEDFETGDFTSFPWSFSGDFDWIIDTDNSYEGEYSARSGNIGDNQNSEISIDLETTFEGRITFYLKVSTEAGYDFVNFYIDGEEKANWSGVMDWQMLDHFVQPGLHNFKWVYEKDQSVSNGDDCCWLDYITFPPTGEVSTSENDIFTDVKLIGNYPNPLELTGKSSDYTTIKYQLAQESSVKFHIYNIKGQKVKTLLNDEIQAGLHSVSWNGEDNNGNYVSSGIYFYEMVINDKTRDSKKLLILK